MRLGGPVAWLALALLCLLLTLQPRPSHAGAVELVRAEVQRTPEGVMLDLETRVALPPGVEDALQKGVALHFVAEAELKRERWYWRDQVVAHAVRTWRLTYQPLTMKYRISLGGLSQTYVTLTEALSLIERSTRWRIADALAPNDDGHYYVETSFKLDLNQLPRPLLIGIGTQPEWNLELTRTIPLPPPAK